jgi:hypothetical protein
MTEATRTPFREAVPFACGAMLGRARYQLRRPFGRKYGVTGRSLLLLEMQR